jgi:catechol 2,3-dioxygenase-like lactoylglutathione lyase family enzyme
VFGCGDFPLVAVRSYLKVTDADEEVPLPASASIMITSGNVTVYVSDIDQAIDFYVNVLGLKLGQRFGNNWAQIEVGQSLVIGLHPKSEKGPRPGTSGAISIGLLIDEPIDQAVQHLGNKGVRFRGPVMRDENAGIAVAFFGDQDGNDLYLCQMIRSW